MGKTMSKSDVLKTTMNRERDQLSMRKLRYSFKILQNTVLIFYNEEKVGKIS